MVVKNFFQFTLFDYKIADSAVDEFLGFGYQFADELVIEVFTHEYEVDDFGVDAFGKVACDVSGFEVADLTCYPIDDFVDANEFFEDIVDIIKQGVFCIGMKIFAVSHKFGFEHTGFFKAVEFDPYGIG